MGPPSLGRGVDRIWEDSKDLTFVGFGASLALFWLLVHCSAPAFAGHVSKEEQNSLDEAELPKGVICTH